MDRNYTNAIGETMYFVEVVYKENTVYLKVIERTAIKAKRKAVLFAVNQGWGMPEYAKSYRVGDREVEHIFTRHH